MSMIQYVANMSTKYVAN